MLIKKTTIAIILNLIFGGAGYLYLQENTRVPLGVFLIFVTIFEFFRQFTEGPNMGTQGNPLAILPMFSMFGTFFGLVLFIAMAVDIYFIVKRQTTLTKR